MYVPTHYSEHRTQELYDYIRLNSLGILLNISFSGIEVSFVPFLLDVGKGAKGTLMGHIARANEHWQKLRDTPEATVIFLGPNVYISPSWLQNPEAVPTWNYVSVLVRGNFRLLDNEECLKESILKMVERFEEAQCHPWSTGHLKDEYFQGRLKHIVGFEIEITSIEGKRKLSQNRSEADRKSIISALMSKRDSNSEAIAKLMLDDLIRLKEPVL